MRLSYLPVILWRIDFARCHLCRNCSLFGIPRIRTLTASHHGTHSEDRHYTINGVAAGSAGRPGSTRRFQYKSVIRAIFRGARRLPFFMMDVFLMSVAHNAAAAV